MAKIIKNTTGVAVVVRETGTTIAANGSFEIDPINYGYWATPETITELTARINSGDLVVNDGVIDLSASRGLAYLLATNATHLNGILLDQTLIADGRVPTYDSITGTLKYVTPASANGQAAGDKGWVQYRGNTIGSFDANIELKWNATKLALTIGDDPGGTLNNLVLAMTRSINSYIQATIQNRSSGTQASCDLVVENNLGTDETYYGDFGINSSGYQDNAYPLSLENDTYLYCTGGNLTVGTADRQFGTGSLKDLIMHTGGFMLDNERVRLIDAVLKKDAVIKLSAVLRFDNGTTADRPTTPLAGMCRYNTTTNAFEFYENGVWVGLGSTGANVGTGQGQVFRDKVAQTLNFKTLKEGVGTSIVNNANDITISSLGGVGSGGLFIANFSNTANSNNNVFLNTFGVASSDGLPAVAPLTGTINKVTISLSGGVGTGTFEFRVNATTGTPAFTATITGAQTASVNVSFMVNSNDKINCKIASGASGISKPLVNIYM